MQSAQEIYHNTISHLPSQEKLQLAALILSDLAATKTEEKLSAIELLDSFVPGRAFKTSKEVDEYLRQEREAWDR